MQGVESRVETTLRSGDFLNTTLLARRPGSRSYLLLAFFCLALYLPGVARIPPLDRDEARFAETTKQMIESGDFVHPRFQNEARYKKPIGIYWLQAAAVLAAGESSRRQIWPYRVPSTIAAIAAVLMTCRIGCELFGGGVGLLGAMLLGSSLLLVAEATLATTDAVLLACVVCVQACLAALYLAARRQREAPALYALGFWLGTGLGILVKGPVLPMLTVLTLGALFAMDWRYEPKEVRRRWSRFCARGLRWQWGVPVVLAIVLPWTVAAQRADGGMFYEQAFREDLMPKLTAGREGHGFPPGYYLILSMLTFWPGSLVAGLGVLRAVRRSSRPGERFCLAWLTPSWIAFELIPTKLPHYVLPTYPALALLTARAVLARWPRQFPRRLFRAEAVVWSAITAGAGATIVAAPILLGGGFYPPSLIPAAAAIGMGVVAVRSAWSVELARAASIAAVAAVAVVGPTSAWVIPRLDALWLSREAAQAVAAKRGSARTLPRVAVVGFDEPSMVFLIGSDAVFTSPESATGLLAEDADGLALVAKDSEPAFQAAAERRGLRLRALWSGSGLNYSKGRRVSLKLIGRQSDSRSSQAGRVPEIRARGVKP